MKRPGIARKTPMRRTKPLRSSGKRPKKDLMLGRMKTGPWKSRAHLDRVKGQPCLVFTHGVSWVKDRCAGPMDPHHCRKLLSGGLLPRHDSLAVPLCRLHHKMMDGDERDTWRRHGIDPAAWIAAFSPEGAAEIAKLRAGKETP